MVLYLAVHAWPLLEGTKKGERFFPAPQLVKKRIKKGVVSSPTTPKNGDKKRQEYPYEDTLACNYVKYLLTFELD